MKKLRKALIAGTILASFGIVAVLASPSTAAEIGERIKSGFSDIFFNTSVPESDVTQAAAVSNFSAFHFLDPLVPSSGDLSKFDPSYLSYLRVEVCAVTSSGCPLVKTFTNQSAGSEQLRIEKNYYIVAWDTQKVSLNDKTYRVRVLLGNIELGSVDLTPNVYTKFGRTWPIKFLIEKEPNLRIAFMRASGKSCSQLASVLRQEYGLNADEVAALLAGGPEPCSDEQIKLAIDGVFQSVIVPFTTKVSDDETRNALLSFDPATGEMIFLGETSVLKSLNIGDVLVSEPGPGAPAGYLRKVTSIRRSKTQYTLETVQAKLNEAISQGTLKAAGQLLPSDIGSSNAALYSLGSRTQSFAPVGPNALDVGDNFNFHRDIDVTIDFAGETGGVSGTGTVHMTGSIDFNAGWDIGIGIETCLKVPPVCVDRVEGHADVHQQSHIRVDGKFNGELHKQKVIDTIPFAPITFFVGPIPVVIVPKIDIVVGIDGKAHADFVFAADATSDVKLGAKWTDPDDGGKGWEDIREFNPLGGHISEAGLNADLKVEGWGKANAKLLLYDVAGPGVGARVGLLAEVQTGHKPLWTIYGHIVGDVDFTVDVGPFGAIIDIGDYSKTVLDESFKIGEAPNQVPNCSSAATATVEIGKPTIIGPQSGFEGYFTCTDPEGEAISYRAVSSNTNDGVNGVIADNAGSVVYTFLTGDKRTITITATDASGGTAPSFSIIIDVHNSLPIVNVFAGTTAEAGVQFFMSAEAFDPDTNAFLPCSRIDWAAPPDTVTELNGGCGGVVTFGQSGTHTVTVTATDFYGGVGTKSISVIVAPKPANLPPVIDAASLEIHADSDQGGGICWFSNNFCLVPETTQYLWPGFGQRESDEWGVPLTMWVDATDPEGDPINYEWRCQDQAGTQVVIATSLGDGVYQCTPPYVPGVVIQVYAIVSDGTPRPNNTTIPRTFFYRVRPN